ncbi:MAG: NAD-dependent epimerase/dehydratase family protein [Thermodesulfobacteriota bacterium]
MKILITGVSGFIGSHLAERLLKDGYRVTGVDSFLDYYPRRIKENNLKGLSGKKDFEFIEADLLDLELGRLLNGIEAVFHQAAIAGVRASWGGRFNQYVRNNILGTQLLLEACKYKDLKKFVYASSSSVYGDAEEFPITETSPVKPLSPYGVSKLAGEQLAYLYFKGYGVPVVSLRYFTVYGPRQRPDMAFHKFLKEVMLGGEIEVYGTGKQTRDFTFIADAVEANIRAFSKGVDGETYNIGGGSRIELIECIRLIEEISGKKVRLRFGESQRGDAGHTYADVSKAVRDFQYSPRVGIGEGLTEHYKWLTENLEVYLG